MSAEPLILTEARVSRPAAAAALPLAVEPLHPLREAEWDRYVRESPDATFFHQLGWRWLVERVFGTSHRPPAA